MPSWWFLRQKPSDEETPDVGYDSFFSGDGTEGTTAGSLYRKDSDGHVTLVGGGSGGGGGDTYTDEQAQDAVGRILSDTTTIDFTYNDSANAISAVVRADSIGAAELATGAVGTAELAANAVTDAVLADMPGATIKARQTGPAGDPQNLTGPQVKALMSFTSTDLGDFVEAAQDAVGAALQDSASIHLAYNDAANAITGQVQALGITAGMIAANAVTSAQLAANAVTTVKLAADAVSNDKLADMPAKTFKANKTTGSANPTDVTVPDAKAMLAYTASDIAAAPFGTITATNVQTALQALYSLIQGGGGGGGTGSITYTTPGTYFLTLPGGQTRICLIAGGAGGDTLGQPIGGGGGEYAESTLNLTPGNYTVIVGAGGGPNLVGFPSTFNGNLVVANPGTLGGSFGAGTGLGGTGGIGQILFNGGNGGPAATGPTLPGAGGGGAGSAGSGSNGAIGYGAAGGGGGPGTPHGGSGGAAGVHGTFGADTGGDGNTPGGGGGGGGAGSSGAGGMAVVTWSATDAASGTAFNVAGGNVYFGGAYWNGVENGQPTFFNNASILSDNSDLTYIVGSASKQSGGGPSPGDRYYVQFSVSDIVVFQPDPRVIASFTVTARVSGPRASTLTVQNLAGPAIGTPMTAHYTSTTFGIQTITAGPFTKPGGGNWAGGDLQNLQLVVALDVDGGYQSGDAGHVPIDANSPPEINDTRVLKVYKLTVTPSYV